MFGRRGMMRRRRDLAIEALVNAGGAVGGGATGYPGGGGGAGGLLIFADRLKPGSYPVVVAPASSGPGFNSSFLGRVALGGGRGSDGGSGQGGPGGSGGGGGGPNNGGGLGTPGQGNNGAPAGSAGGGGGGAGGAAGGNAGGAGRLSNFNGLNVIYSRGGSGGGFSLGLPGPRNGAPGVFPGGGGDGAGGSAAPFGGGGQGAAGIVFVRYLGPPRATGGDRIDTGFIDGVLMTVHTYYTSGTFKVL